MARPRLLPRRSLRGLACFCRQYRRSGMRCAGPFIAM